MLEITQYQAIVTALFLAIPLFISGAFHMLVVSKNWLAMTAVPLQLKAFGVNKTWRGVIVMMLATVPGVYIAIGMVPLFGATLVVDISAINPWYLGLSLGFAYVLFELPNSYIKRRLNIAPGEAASKNTFLFSLMDQMDSAIGCALAYWLLLDIPILVILWIILLGPVVHVIANLSLYSFGLRKRPI